MQHRCIVQAVQASRAICSHDAMDDSAHESSEERVSCCVALLDASPEDSWRQQPRFCTNCTTRLHPDADLDDSWPCAACGHAPANDPDLLQQPMHATQQPLQQQPVQPCERVALLFDERMELHEEESGGAAPHPERPNRLRAIVTRLQAGGTVGEHLRDMGRGQVGGKEVRVADMLSEW